MPIQISDAARADKNKLMSDVAWIDFLEFVYADEDPVRICSYDGICVWRGVDWYPVEFTKPEIETSKDAQIPDISIAFHDITQEVIPIIDKYDGAGGATVTLYSVLSTQLDNPVPELEEQMEVLSATVDSRSIITFKLGAENLANQKCTPNRFLKNFCRYEEGLNDDRCGYAGPESVCNRTFARCKMLGNIQNFGGQPAMGRLGVQV